MTTYTVTYILDKYKYEMEDGYRVDGFFEDEHLENGEWVLSEEDFNADHITKLMIDVFDRFIPNGSEIMDRRPAYVIDDIIDGDDGRDVMVEYDMCLGVLVNGERVSDVESTRLINSIGFNFA